MTPPAPGTRTTAEELERLAAAFSVLGSFHRAAPDEQRLATLWELIDEWPLPAGQDTTVGLAALRQSQAAGETAEQIRSDHAALYGDYAVAKVAPYESVHRGLDGLVFDEDTIKVRDAYRLLQLQAPHLNREPDDHIGLELDFIAQACLRALDAEEAGRPELAERYVRIATEFMTQHIQAWAPRVLREVAKLADTAFMRGVALLSLGALASFTQSVGSTS